MSKKGPRTPNPVVEAREATGISKCLHIRPPCYERALTGKEASLVCKRIMRKQVFLWKNNEQCPTLYPHSSLFSLKLETSQRSLSSVRRMSVRDPWSDENQRGRAPPRPYSVCYHATGRRSTMGWETPVKKGVIRRPLSTKLLTVEADYVEDDWYNASFSYDLEKLGTTQSEIPCLVFILERNTNMGQSNKERISRAKHLSPVFCSRRNHQPPANSLPIQIPIPEVGGKALICWRTLAVAIIWSIFLERNSWCFNSKNASWDKIVESFASVPAAPLAISLTKQARKQRILGTNHGKAERVLG
ncbi:hypothetical protein ACFE04_001955 [Oxalis oulophora]